MASLPGFPIFGKIISGNRRYPVDLRPGTIATITLTRLTGDLDMWLLNYGQRIAQSEKGQLQDEKIVFSVESPGRYQIEVRPYGSQPDATFTLDAQAEAATSEPALFRAAMITNNSPDMQAYAAKLRNIKGDGAPAAFGVDVRVPISTGVWDINQYDLIIIGDDTHNWQGIGVAGLAARPLLLIGAGGRSFLYVIRPELTGLIAQTVGREMRFEAPTDHPIWRTPYPMTVDRYGLELYPDWREQYGALMSRAGSTEIAGGAWGIHTVMKIEPRIGYYGYPAVPDAWEGWGVLCNLATDLAARGKTA